MPSIQEIHQKHQVERNIENINTAKKLGSNPKTTLHKILNMATQSGRQNSDHRRHQRRAARLLSKLTPGIRPWNISTLKMFTGPEEAHLRSFHPRETS